MVDKRHDGSRLAREGRGCVIFGFWSNDTRSGAEATQRLAFEFWDASQSGSEAMRAGWADHAGFQPLFRICLASSGVTVSSVGGGGVARMRGGGVSNAAGSGSAGPSVEG